MLNKLEVFSPAGDTLTLTIGDPSNGYNIEDMEGLTPVPANLVSTTLARLDGEQYQASRREKRNLLLKMGLDRSSTGRNVTELRNDLYRFFMPKSVAELRFHTDTLGILDIEGHVETFDCPPFVQEVKADISIVCFNPDFYDPVPKSLISASTSGSTVQKVQYDGTVETGVKFTISINRALTSFILYRTGGSGAYQRMEFAGNFVAGDTITVSTSPGDKYVTMKRGGIESSILYALTPYSPWIELSPGENEIRMYAVGSPAIPYIMEYTTKFGGL